MINNMVISEFSEWIHVNYACSTMPKKKKRIQKRKEKERQDASYGAKGSRPLNACLPNFNYDNVMIM